MTSTLFCLDFDETLSNTDRLRADLLEAIRSLGKEELAATYLEAYEAVRKEYGGVSIPHVLRVVAEQPGTDSDLHHRLAELFHAFPYQQYIYPGAEQAIAQLQKQGKVLVFSDGDAFFHPQKIYATSLARLVDGVVILPKKIECFAELSSYYPADRYVFIDDKQKVLDAAKSFFGEQATTILVKQGRYADSTTDDASAGMTVMSIAEVADLSF